MNCNTSFFKAILFAVLPLYTFSQSQLLKQEYNLKTKIADEGANMAKLASAYSENIFYFTTLSETDKKSRWIYSYNVRSGKQDSIAIKLTKQTKQLFSHRLYWMEVVHEHIILMNDACVYVFSFTNGGTKFKFSLQLERKFNQAFKLNDNELLMYVNYNFHPKSSAEKHVWAKLNIKEQVIYPFKQMDEGNTRFTSLNNRWISVYKGLIAYAQTTDYRIRFYDSDFRLKDSLVSDKLDANKKPLSLLNPVYEYSRDEVIRDMKMDDTCLTRIQKIFLLDSTHLLVMLKLPKTFKCRFDLWKKAGSGWQLKDNETLAGFYDKDIAYTAKNQPTQSLFGNIIGISYENHAFYTVYYPFMEDIITHSFNRQKDYEEVLNTMAKKGNLFYGIRKYKVSLD